MLLFGCGKDEIQLPDTPLEGLVNGEAWSYKSANAYIFSTDSKYEVKFLSSKESVKDPCSLPNPSLPHVTAILRLPKYSGDYTVTQQVINNNEAIVTFDANFSSHLTANNGFLSIYATENNIVYGYLQAVWDDDNTVEGAFEIRICN